MQFEWQVPFIVIGSIALILFFFGRPKGEGDDSDETPSGADLIERLQRTLGIAIVVESVESAADVAASPADSVDRAGPVGPGEPFTIRASFMYGRNSTQVVVGGATESDAWAALARAAIDWRNSDFQHVQMWPGGG